MAHRVRDVDGLPHDVNLACVGAAVVRAQVRDLQAVVVPDADPGNGMSHIYKYDFLFICTNLAIRSSI